MALFALADTHLSFAKNKPMDIFDEVWKDHPQKIKENWLKTVTEDDTVFMPGDISWAINYEELAPDMDFLTALPGKKIISPGNHDYWWNSTQRLNELYKDKGFSFVKSTFHPYAKTALCATRGWICPNDTRYTPQDEKIYKREVGRLRLSLELAIKAGYNDIIVMMHFPPTNDKKDESGFTELIKKFGVRKVVYGHLHSNRSYNASLQGIVENTEYILVSSDFLNFTPVKIAN